MRVTSPPCLAPSLRKLIPRTIAVALSCGLACHHRDPRRAGVERGPAFAVGGVDYRWGRLDALQTGVAKEVGRMCAVLRALLFHGSHLAGDRP